MRPPGLPLATAFAGLVFLALHLPFLSWAPDDIDATNFMLALRDYDLRQHQPHPPGYPVFIAMGHVARASLSAVGAVSGPSAPETLDVNALAIVSTLFGAVTIVPLVAFWNILGGDRTRAWLAAALALASPVVWYTGIRPFSDLPGVAIAVASLALLASGGGLPGTSPRVINQRFVLAGAILAGLAIGVRSQTLWLTAPALVLTAAVALWRRDLRVLSHVAVGSLVGALLWAVPLVIVLGGWRNYVDVLASQAADDFRGAILAVDFSPRVLAMALYDTFVMPWNNVVLATAVLTLALVGGVGLLLARTREALLIAMLFGPYLILHLLFHETDHTRYAIPLTLAVSYLSVCGLRPSRTWRKVAGLSLIVTASSISMGPVKEQAGLGSPSVAALQDVRQALAVTTERPVLAMHHSVHRQLRFASFDDQSLASPPRYEWLAVVDHFRTGGEAPVWFLANQRRSDLVLFDPAAKQVLREYEWSFAPGGLLGGARPQAITWFEITRPGWMAGEGWSLTPETRGVAHRAHRLPGTSGTVAYLARRPGPAVLMIGGRNLGGPCLTAAQLDVTLDGRPVARWQIPAGEPFVYFVDLPAGALDGPRGYAVLRLHASELTGTGLGVDVSLEQFDVQSERRPVAALAQGWHEPELEPLTGRRWRWTSQRAVIQLRNFGRDVVLRLRADDPTLTVGRGVELRVRAAGHVVAQKHFAAPVNWDIRIPTALIDEAQGRLTLTSDASFVPDTTEHNGDHRELALRVFDLDVVFDETSTIARR